MMCQKEACAIMDRVDTACDELARQLITMRGYVFFKPEKIRHIDGKTVNDKKPVRRVQYPDRETRGQYSMVFRDRDLR